MIEVKELSELLFKSKTPISRLMVRDLGDNDIIYARRFESPAFGFKFNLPKGKYKVITDGTEPPELVETRKPFYYKKITLPEPTKRKFKTADRVKKRIKREGLTGSPASINVRHGIIVTNERFERLPKYAKEFILAHEEGHLKYKSEEYCDLYALKKILDKGGNLSPCIVTLERVLGKTPASRMRLIALVNNGKMIN